MYPLSMHNPQAGGYALASDEAEHKALTDAGYGPAFVAPVEATEATDVDEPVKRGPGRPRKAE